MNDKSSLGHGTMYNRTPEQAFGVMSLSVQHFLVQVCAEGEGKRFSGSGWSGFFRVVSLTYRDRLFEID